MASGSKFDCVCEPSEKASHVQITASLLKRTGWQYLDLYVSKLASISDPTVALKWLSLTLTPRWNNDVTMSTEVLKNATDIYLSLWNKAFLMERSAMPVPDGLLEYLSREAEPIAFSKRAKVEQAEFKYRRYWEEVIGFCEGNKIVGIDRGL